MLRATNGQDEFEGEQGQGIKNNCEDEVRSRGIGFSEQTTGKGWRTQAELQASTVGVADQWESWCSSAHVFIPQQLAINKEKMK